MHPYTQALLKQLIADGVLAVAEGCPREDLRGCEIVVSGVTDRGEDNSFRVLLVPDDRATRFAFQCVEPTEWGSLEGQRVTVRGTLDWLPPPFPCPDPANQLCSPIPDEGWLVMPTCEIVP